MKLYDKRGNELRKRANLKMKALTPEQERAVDCAERHYAKAAALMAGAVSLLNDRTGEVRWPGDVTADVAIQLLEESIQERDAARAQQRKAKVA